MKPKKIAAIAMVAVGCLALFTPMIIGSASDLMAKGIPTDVAYFAAIGFLVSTLVGIGSLCGLVAWGISILILD